MELFYRDEKVREELRDKIIVLEDIEKRDAFYLKHFNYRWTKDFREMKVLNWEGKVRYLIIDYSDEFVIVISSHSQLEIIENDLWEDENHEFVFSSYEDSFPGTSAAARLPFEYAVLSEAWSTPYYELLRKLVNAFREEPRFRVITLCGSTRFKDEFLMVQKRLTLEGNIVISVGLFGHSGDEEVWDPGVKDMLDEMHRRKIDISNEIFVINKNGYIGESTKAEIEYAEAHGKTIRYLEAVEWE